MVNGLPWWGFLDPCARARGNYNSQFIKLTLYMCSETETYELDTWELGNTGEEVE